MLGVELLIIGMGTVILSLYLLSVFLFFSGKLFGPEAGKKKKKKQEKNASEKIKVGSKSIQVEGLDKKKIAAITAALYEIMNNSNDISIISMNKK